MLSLPLCFANLPSRLASICRSIMHTPDVRTNYCSIIATAGPHASVNWSTHNWVQFVISAPYLLGQICACARETELVRLCQHDAFFPGFPLLVNVTVTSSTSVTNCPGRSFRLEMLSLGVAPNLPFPFSSKEVATPSVCWL